MRVKWWLLPVLLMLHVLTTHGFEDLADDDFAEFETFPSDDNEVIKPKEILDDFEDDNIEIKSEDEEFPTSQDSEDEIVEEDDNEFEHFQDTEEFEGYQDAPPRPAEPDLKISKVPITHRQRWDAYWLEGILCCLLAAYALVYAVGRSKNTSIAEEFLREHRQLLEENFTLVGETGSDVVAADGARGWRREAEHVFTMWCSGRLGCEGVLLTLRLNKRQDLVHVILGLFRPAADALLVRAELPRDDADPCVLAVGQKKIVAKMAKEMQDLSVFCAERRAADRPGLPAALAVVAECAETAGVLDARACAALAQCAPRVHYVHVSDRYAGPKVVDEQAGTKPPETERVLLASFAAEDARPLLLLTLHLVDRVKRHRLSKEALAKCEKRRQKVAEAWQRGAHAARQEQAAARREEKRKQEKEKILAEDDPEKQRRWELKEQKRQQKRKTPKMKQLKVKAL